MLANTGGSLKPVRRSPGRANYSRKGYGERASCDDQTARHRRPCGAGGRWRSRRRHRTKGRALCLGLSLLLKHTDTLRDTAAKLLRRGAELGALGPHRAELEFGNLSERIE